MKIFKEPIEEGIKQLIDFLNTKGIKSKIDILRIPKDDVNKKNSFIEIASYTGSIKSKFLNKKDFTFYSPIPNRTHRKSINWKKNIAYQYLTEVERLMLDKEGLSENVKKFDKLKIDLIDEIYKSI